MRPAIVRLPWMASICSVIYAETAALGFGKTDWKFKQEPRCWYTSNLALFGISGWPIIDFRLLERAVRRPIALNEKRCIDLFSH